MQHAGDERLIIRCARNPLEGAWGWLIRVAEANHLSSPLKVTGLARKLGRSQDDAGHICVLASITGNPVEDTAYVFSSRNYRATYPGDRFPPRFLEKRHSKICPICIQESGFIYAAWDLRIWTSCPIHGINMTSFCQNCGSTLSYDRPGIGTCGNAKCRCDLTTQPTTLSSSHEILVLNYLLPLVGRELPYTATPVPFLNESRTTEDVVLFLYGIAHSLGIDRNSILPDTASFLMNWPNSGYQLIETKLSTAKSQTFGTILPLALRNKTHYTPKYLMDSFKRGLNQIVDKRPAADVRPNFDRDGGLEWITVAQASNLLKISPDFLRSILSMNSIDTKVFRTPNGIRTYIMVRKSSMDEIETQIPDIVRSPVFRKRNGYTITSRDIEYALNVSEVSSGLIIRNSSLFPNTLAYSDKRQKFFVLKSDFDRFMENISNLITLKKSTSKRLIPLCDVSKFLAHASIDKVILALIDRTIHLTRKDGLSDFSLMYIDIDSIRFIDASSFRASHPGALGRTDRLISSTEAADLMGASSWCIAQLIDLGFITRLLKLPNRGSLLSYENLLKFRTNYISDRELSLILNIPRIELTNALIENSIAPDIYPRIGRECHFWKISRLSLYSKELRRSVLSRAFKESDHNGNIRQNLRLKSSKFALPTGGRN